MIKIRNFLLIGLLALLVPLNSTAAAAKEITIDEMKEYLIDIHIPYDCVHTLNDENVKTLYGEMISQNIAYGGTVVTELTETIIPTDLIDQTLTIPNSNLNFTVTTLYSYVSTTKQITQMYVYINYDWTKIPYWKKKDAVIVNWDSNIFTYKSNSFDCFCYADYKGTIEGDFTKERKFENPNEILQGALGYDIDLRVIYASVARLYGYCRFTLLPAQNPIYNTPSSNTNQYITSINAQYRHNQNPFVGSIGFSVMGASINFNLSTFTNSTANSANAIFYK